MRCPRCELYLAVCACTPLKIEWPHDEVDRPIRPPGERMRRRGEVARNLGSKVTRHAKAEERRWKE